MKYNFCTLFDRNYLPNFLALLTSLIKYSSFNSSIHVFCMDDDTLNFLSCYKTDNCVEITPVSVTSLLSYYPELEQIKESRSVVEFYFTCSPFICEYVLSNNTEISHITYLDADLYFFDSPKLVFDEIGDSSISIIRHKFYGWGKRYLKHGIFNVGWITFRNDFNGTSCLASWKKNCAQWCFDYYDEQGDRFADQKYLEKWPFDFQSVKILENKGFNLAPWNIGQYSICILDGKIRIDDDPLVFYHFASFKKIRDGVFSTNLSRFLAKPNRLIKESIYRPYLHEVNKFNTLIQSENPKAILNKNRKKVFKNTFSQIITKSFIIVCRIFLNDYIRL